MDAPYVSATTQTLPFNPLPKPRLNASFKSVLHLEEKGTLTNPGRSTGSADPTAPAPPGRTRHPC